MTVTAGLVKELREKTGAGMMECKKALLAAEGDMDKAIIHLRERGMSRAAQKSSRIAAEGLITLHIDQEKKRAAIAEINCETDFVSRNQDFSSFAQQAVAHAASHGLPTTEELLAADLSGRTVGERLVDMVSRIGENLTISRLRLCDFATAGFVTGYVHLGGKLGTLVSLKNATLGEYQNLGRDLALHVIASAPRYLVPNEVSAAEIEQEKAIATKKLQQEGKPEQIIPRIIEGQLKKFYSEICFLQQPYVKEPKLSVQEFMHKNAPKVEIAEFVRFQVGEGNR